MQQSKIQEVLEDNWPNILKLEGLKLSVNPGNQKSFSGEDVDLIISLSYKKISIKLSSELVDNKRSREFSDKVSRLISLKEKNNRINPLLISSYLSRERRGICKNSSINYIDLSGNVFIAAEGLLLDRDGYPNLFPEKRNGRNPFADKSSIILRKMLLEKDKYWGIREISKELNLNPGFVSRIISELKGREYIEEKQNGIRLIHKKELLQEWLGFYNYNKNEKSNYFLLAKDVSEILNKLKKVNSRIANNIALGLQAGGNLVSSYSNYSEIHVYVSDNEYMKEIINFLNLAKVDRGANVILLQPYYKSSVFYNKQKIKGHWVVSNLQLYLDLFNYPLRGLEQAEHIYNKKLKEYIELENE